MSTQSLYVRLGLIATLIIVLALTLAAFGLRSIFNREIERRATAELSHIVTAIAAQAGVDKEGRPALDANLSDQRFDEPYGGIYWQVSRADGRNARSRSLWDYELKLQDFDTPGQPRTVTMDGPNGSRLLAVARTIIVPGASKEDVPLWIVAALYRDDIARSQRSVLHLLVISLVALGLILVLAMLTFLRLALSPFRKLAGELQAIHSGRSRALTGAFPAEVQGVVDDLNRLIAFQDAAIERARTQAGDLAHGLKTPLAILAAIGRQAKEAARDDLAKPIEEQVTQMRRQVDRVLARARAGAAAALGREPIMIAPVAGKVVRAFERLADGERLDWEVKISPQAVFPGEEADLIEMLGNLLDNACKWANRRVRLSATATEGALCIDIEDDGPGLPAEIATDIARGRRFDESQPGTGFGLAITRELAEIYQGTLALNRSDLGGLQATLRIPVRAAQRKKGVAT